MHKRRAPAEDSHVAKMSRTLDYDTTLQNKICRTLTWYKQGVIDQKQLLLPYGGAVTLQDYHSAAETLGMTDLVAKIEEIQGWAKVVPLDTQYMLRYATIPPSIVVSNVMRQVNPKKLIKRGLDEWVLKSIPTESRTLWLTSVDLSWIQTDDWYVATWDMDLVPWLEIRFKSIVGPGRLYDSYVRHFEAKPCTQYNNPYHFVAAFMGLGDQWDDFTGKPVSQKAA